MTMQILDKEQIKASLNIEMAYNLIKEGFRLHANQKSVLPPVGQLNLEKGSLHIKYGMIEGQDIFVVKQATGFSSNWENNLPTGDGFISVYCAQTGLLKALLLDQGYLTDLRTALSVRYCVERYAPAKTKQIGIIGTGTQALLSAEHQLQATGCRNILLWGRNQQRVTRVEKLLKEKGFCVSIRPSAQDVFNGSDVMITTTASRSPLIQNQGVVGNKLVIAVGADEKGKQELDPDLLSGADHLFADHPKQCFLIGELQYYTGDPVRIKLVGSDLPGGRKSLSGLVVVDLTGTAVADIQISRALLEGLSPVADRRQI